MPFQKVGKPPKPNIPLFVIKIKNIQRLLDFYTPYYNAYVTEDKLRKLEIQMKSKKYLEKISITFYA